MAEPDPEPVEGAPLRSRLWWGFWKRWRVVLLSICAMWCSAWAVQFGVGGSSAGVGLVGYFFIATFAGLTFCELAICRLQRWLRQVVIGVVGVSVVVTATLVSAHNRGSSGTERWGVAFASLGYWLVPAVSVEIRSTRCSGRKPVFPPLPVPVAELVHVGCGFFALVLSELILWMLALQLGWVSK